MSEEKKGYEEQRESLKALLEQYETNTEPMEITFGNGTTVETDLFSFLIPEGYQCRNDLEGLEAVCYLDDWETTPLQITIKSEPLVLISPEDHKKELRDSLSQSRGMVVSEVEIGGAASLRCDIPTLGGQQIFFPIYHETELFSLRINFIGKITNNDAVLEKILSSFRFKNFTPRFTEDVVDSVIHVFERSRKDLRERFETAEKNLDSSEGAQELCQSYGNALFGCFRVFSGEMEKICRWDVSDSDWERLCAFGHAICDDLDFSLTYDEDQYSVAMSEIARGMMEAWKR